MDEHAARDVVLLRAIETTDASAEIFTVDDRRHAGRAAGELTRWHATQQRAAASDDVFLARRAALALDALGERAAAVRAMRQTRWRPWLGVVLPLAALALGAVVEQVADRQHVNVLAFPLLGIILWNLAVYALMLLRPLLGRSMGPLRRWLAGGPRLRAATDGTLTAAASRFVADWATISQPLLNARAGRVLHLSAALFALGALLGLYVRALAFEYRIGWESTFLDASTVHALLSTLLGPAARLLGMPFPGVEAIDAMRITAGRGGVDAGPWIHLYAVTLAALVIVPRSLLAAWCAWRERHYAADLPFDRGTPYFRRVLADFSARAARVRAQPYSLTLDEAQSAGLAAIARHLFGDAAQLALRPSTGFGDEDTAAQGLPRREDDVPLTLAVFTAAATPENENHGRFVDTLRAALDTPLALLVDSGPYTRRLGTQAGAAARAEERLSTWRTFAGERGLAVSCTDLAAPDLPAVERALARAADSAP